MLLNKRISLARYKVVGSSEVDGKEFFVVRVLRQQTATKISDYFLKGRLQMFAKFSSKYFLFTLKPASQLSAYL